MAADPEVTKCTCPDILCEWHGKCKECVALHRTKNTHLPACLHHLVKDNILALLKSIEMTATEIEITSPEYRHYVVERDEAENSLDDFQISNASIEHTLQEYQAAINNERNTAGINNESIEKPAVNRTNSTIDH